MTVTARCHCGATQITLPAMPTEGGVCNCTFCNRTGAVWASYDQSEVKVVAEQTAVYSPSSPANAHQFCGRCGGNTHGYAPDYSKAFNMDGTPKDGVELDMSDEARRISVNLRMIDDFDPASISLTHMDGRNNW